MADHRDVNMEGDGQTPRQVVHNPAPAHGTLPPPADPNPAAPSFTLDEPVTALLVQIMHRSNTVLAQQMMATLPALINNAITAALAQSSGQPTEQAQATTPQPITNPQQQEVAQQTAQPQPAQPMEVDEGPKTPRRRGQREPPKSPGKKASEQNAWNSGLRKYLEGEHVGLCKTNNPSPTADPERVKAYTQHGRDPPSLPNPQMDWTTGPESPWNARLIHLMAKGYHLMVKDNPAYAPPEFVKLRSLTHAKECVTARIKKTRTEWRRRNRLFLEDPEGADALLKAEDEAEDKGVRRTGRRRGLYARRIKNIKKYHATKDPAYWEAVIKVLEELTEDGMSSDETDAEVQGNGPKKTRRIAKPWLSGEVSELMRAIDKAPLPRTAHRGNQPFDRNSEARPVTTELDPTSHTMCYMKHLPRNYYSDIWFEGLPEFEKEEVDPTPAKLLPTPN
ncbi:hypothetical protein MD484_g7905, partial [Candolleomyces efflorescens]